MASFIPEFKERYYDALKRPAGQNPVRDRSGGFLKIFQALEDMGLTSYNLLETGSMRADHGNISLGDDGASTFLFDKFLDFHDGILISIDNDIDSIIHSMKLTKHAMYYCGDSIEALKNLPDDIRLDLVYFDSFDFTFANADQARQHQLKEFSAIAKNCHQGTIIASDDFILPNTDIRGKGEFLKVELDNVKAELIHEGYQLIYQL